MTTITTERLALRPLVLADAQRYSALSSDLGVAGMTCAIPHPNPPIVAEGWILLRQARAPLGLEVTFAIDLPGEGLLGVIGATRQAHGACGGWEMGYWLGRPYWGQGFATKAGAAFVGWMRQQGKTPLTASPFADNPASRRVLEKLGFVPDGAVRSSFSLARRDMAIRRPMALPDAVDADHREASAAA